MPERSTTRRPLESNVTLPSTASTRSDRSSGLSELPRTVTALCTLAGKEESSLPGARLTSSTRLESV